jgi:hypothetical protein
MPHIQETMVRSMAPLIIREINVKDRVNPITHPLPDHLHLKSNFEIWYYLSSGKIHELTDKQGSAYEVIKKGF